MPENSVLVWTSQSDIDHVDINDHDDAIVADALPGWRS
jgi:hypothetical protein